MKLFEKFKNMFTEEVEEEVKVEQVPVKTKREVTVPETIDTFEEVIKDKEEVKKPVFFTDHDFEDMENKRITRSNNMNKESNDYSNTRSNYRSLYNEQKKESYINQPSPYGDAYKEKKEEKVFKPTPIISPVYGILDKNYHKEDIVSKSQTNTYNPPAVDGLSVDSVRKKAYGTLEDELENTLFGSNSILFNKKDEETNDTDDFFGELEQESRPDLLDEFVSEETQDDSDKKIKDLEDITMDIGEELNTLLSKKENRKIRETQDQDNGDLFDLIDTMYEGDEK